MSDNEDDKHPALKDFNPTAEQVKHVTKKTVKDGLIGGVIGGVGIPAIAAGATLIGVAATGPIGWALGLLGMKVVGAGTVMTAATTAATSIAVNSAIAGGIAGGAIGLAKGVSGADEAADDKADKLVANYERNKVRAMRQNLIEQKIAGHAPVGGGMVPNPGLPMGLGANERQV